MDDEPTIRINGVQLTEAQALTVRVALTLAGMQWEDADSLGEDVMGRSIAAAYRERLTEIMGMMKCQPARNSRPR